jgi:hypothetical protein
MGKPEQMGSMINQSPLLPNPKAAKMILDRSARAGDEDANDMLWYDHGISEEWTPKSYLHDYKKATSKAAQEAKALGLDMEFTKNAQREINKATTSLKNWEKRTYTPQHDALQDAFDKLEREKSDFRADPKETQMKEQAILEAMDKLLEQKVTRKKAVNRLKLDLYKRVEQDRQNVMYNLSSQNKATRVSDETFGRIANSFAMIGDADLAIGSDEYTGRKGKTLLRARQQARTKGPLELQHRENCEEMLANLMGVLHKDLLEGRDIGTAELTEISWKVEKAERAHAVKEYNSITLDETSHGTTLVHEFGHHIEFRNERVHQRILDFYDARTSGKRTKGVRGYKMEERFKDGKFFDPYVGKYYGKRMPDHDNQHNPATEVLSMGLEALYNDTYWRKMVLQDPEHLMLVLATVKGY